MRGGRWRGEGGGAHSRNCSETRIAPKSTRALIPSSMSAGSARNAANATPRPPPSSALPRLKPNRFRLGLASAPEAVCVSRASAGCETRAAMHLHARAQHFCRRYPRISIAESHRGIVGSHRGIASRDRISGSPSDRAGEQRRERVCERGHLGWERGRQKSVEQPDGRVEYDEFGNDERHLRESGGGGIEWSSSGNQVVTRWSSDCHHHLLQQDRPEASEQHADAADAAAALVEQARQCLPGGSTRRYPADAHLRRDRARPREMRA